jgi:PhnB protein
MAEINPYLNFSGNCEEASQLYQSVFGGELELSRFSEMPPGDESLEIDGNLIMHVSLPLGDGQVLMGSDRPEAMGSTTTGDNVQVSISPDSSEDGKRIFDALAEGGTVTMPYEAQFWGAEYGSLIDRFGIHWMVNYDAGQDG